MKKLTFLISLIAITAIFALGVSANEIYQIPETMFDDVHVTQHIPHTSENDFYDYVGLDPSIFRVTTFEMIKGEWHYSAMVISFVNDESGRMSLSRALENYRLLAYPNETFSRFNDINLYSANLEAYMGMFPYNNVEALRMTLDRMGEYYSAFRVMENEFALLVEDYQSLTSTLNSSLDEIQRLENVVTEQNSQIEKLELDVIKSYTQGLEDSKIVQNSFISIATMPFYFLKSIFNFEVFGINFFTIIQVILTLLFVSIVIKIFI